MEKKLMIVSQDRKKICITANQEMFLKIIKKILTEIYFLNAHVLNIF